VDYNVLVAYAFGILLLYVLVRLLFVPLRWTLVVVYNALLGGVALWLINAVGHYVGLHIGLNFITALVAGFLGIPGVLLLIAVQYLTM